MCRRSTHGDFIHGSAAFPDRLAGFGIGIFQALGKAAFKSRFLWISNIAKPDFALTVLVGVIAVASMPDAPGIYWAASNSVALVQALAVHAVRPRRRSRAT